MTKVSAMITKTVTLCFLKGIREREQILLVDSGCLADLPNQLLRFRVKRPLLVSGRNTPKLSVIKPLLTALNNKGMVFAHYRDCFPNPTIENVEEGLALYKAAKCDCIIAFGGGSAIDCAKIIGARVAYPKRSVLKMRRINSIRREIPYLFAVATTGSGSENTSYAIINDASHCRKYTFFSDRLIPHVAVLDPMAIRLLPPDVTSETGMDALAHAIESYVSIYAEHFPADKANAVIATPMIFQNLVKSYRDGLDIDARMQMALASHYAGLAFRRISCGYAHTFSHRITELYQMSHGLATAIILPYVMEFQFEETMIPMSELAKASGLCPPETDISDAARSLIAGVRDLNARLHIPNKLQGLKQEDFPVIISRSLKEARILGCPKRMTREQARELLEKLLVDTDEPKA